MLIRKVTYIKRKHIRKDIKKIVIPNSIIHVENWAFSGCSILASIMIPGSVTSIGNDAFYYCNKLTNLTFKGKTLEQVKRMNNYPWGIEDESIIKVE